MMVKFIVLGHGRSGSTLVAKSLAEHPNIRVFGELFEANESERRRAFHEMNRTYPLDRLERRYYLDGEDAGEFLQNGIFYDRAWPEIKAVGYKMFWSHARGSPDEKKAWDYLINNRDVRIIHLCRRNLLESYVSLYLARSTRKWERAHGEGEPAQQSEPVVLDKHDCEAYFNQKFAYFQWVRRAFTDHMLFEIEYENDVCGRFESLIHQLHDFLDVPRGPARQLLEKQGRRHPAEIISNYAELREHFRYTLFEDFFE